MGHARQSHHGLIASACPWVARAARSRLRLTNSFFLARDAFTSRACMDEFVNRSRHLAAEATYGHAEPIIQWWTGRVWPMEVGLGRRREIRS